MDGAGRRAAGGAARRWPRPAEPETEARARKAPLRYNRGRGSTLQPLNTTRIRGLDPWRRRPGVGVLPDLVAQLGQGVGLQKVLVAAGLFRLFGGRHPGGVDDHLDVRRVAAFADLPAELQPVDPRHLDVGANHRRLGIPATLPGSVTGFGLDDLVAVQLGKRAQPGSEVEVVVGDKDGWFVIGRNRGGGRAPPRPPPAPSFPFQRPRAPPALSGD